MWTWVRLKLGSLFWRQQGRKKKETLRCHHCCWSDKIPRMNKNSSVSTDTDIFLWAILNGIHPHHLFLRSILTLAIINDINSLFESTFQARFHAAMQSFVKFADKSGGMKCVYSKYIHKLFVQPSCKTTKYALKLHAPKTHFPPSFFIKWTHHLHFWCSALRDTIFRAFETF